MSSLLDDDNEHEYEQPLPGPKVNKLIAVIANFLFPRPRPAEDNVGIDAGGRGLADHQQLTTLWAEELGEDGTARNKIRQSLVIRQHWLRLWIGVLIGLLFPLIIAATILLILSFPSLINVLTLPFAAGTPIGWTILGIMVGAALFVTLAGIIYSGFKLAERFAWGGEIHEGNLSKRQAFLAMMTPIEDYSGDSKITKKLRTVSDSSQPLKPEANEVIDVTYVTLFKEDPNSQPLTRESTEQEILDNETPDEFVNEENELESEILLTESAEEEEPAIKTLLQAFKDCVDAELEAESSRQTFDGGERHVKKTLEQARSAVTTLLEKFSAYQANSKNLSAYIEFVEKLNHGLNHASFGMLDNIKKSFNPIVLNLLRSTASEDLFAADNILQVGRLATPERLRALSKARLQVLSEQFSTYKTSSVYAGLTKNKGLIGNQATERQAEINKLGASLADVLKEKSAAPIFGATPS